MLTITCFVTTPDLLPVITSQVQAIRGVIAGSYQVPITEVHLRVINNIDVRNSNFSPVAIEVWPQTQLTQPVVYADQVRDRLARAVPELHKTTFDVVLQLTATTHPFARHTA